MFPYNCACSLRACACEKKRVCVYVSESESEGESGVVTVRCGWLDLVALKYSVMINGITDIALTKLDVLDHLAEISLCTEYKVDGKVLKSFPSDAKILQKVEPQYKTVKGWQKPLKGIRDYNELPQETLDYFREIEEFTGARITIISNSPDRADTIIR